MVAAGGSAAATGPPDGVSVESAITLGRFLKVAGLVSTGGEAKQVIAAGLVKVNGESETRRGHKLASGDVVEVGGSARRVATRQVPPSEG
ncbi:MAG: RNA-binding S4 domain-containing protein [Actinobacteria bacterium]|nr:RNA-binding S4 domain-containing protein [Actinomycetota bacterium]